MTGPAEPVAGPPVPGGPRGCRDQVAAALAFEMPRKIELARQAWSVTPEELPDIEQVVSGEVPDNTLTSIANTWLVVVVPKTRKRTWVAFDEKGFGVYLVRYAVQIFVWIKTANWALALNARDDTADLINQALVEWPNLTPGRHGDSGYRVVEGTIQVDGGSPLRLNQQGGRLWTGSLLSMDVDVQESTAATSTRGPVGTVESVETTAEVVGPGEPFAAETGS